MFKVITKRNFIVNLIAAGAVGVLLIFTLLWALGFITRHGHYEKVPDVAGKSLKDAVKVLEAKGFKVETQDSIWNEKLPPLSVARVSPEVGQTVKFGRRIYLTINRAQPPMVDLPNMVGLSFRNANLYLQQLGLKLGDTTRRPDIAKDAVLEQRINGVPISTGTKVFLGSTVDFVLGSGIGDEEIEVPDLHGLTFSEAKALLTGMGLNIAGLVPDLDVKDTASSFVYKQNPERVTELAEGFKQVNKIRVGQSVDLYTSVIMRVVVDSTAIKSEEEEDPLPEPKTKKKPK